MLTVVSPTAIHVNSHALAIQKTLQALPVPAKGLLISHEKPSITFGGEWAPITKDWIHRGQWNLQEYNQFLLRGLVDYIDTDHCILVHWDGYGVNRHNWDMEFLNYDYIGAPWPKWLNPTRVGNGGFSLRSKRWLKACSQLPVSEEPEDARCCRELASLNIAPIPIAMRWAIEHRIEEYPNWTVDKSFGFHGFHSKGNERYKIFPQ